MSNTGWLLVVLCSLAWTRVNSFMDAEDNTTTVTMVPLVAEATVSIFKREDVPAIVSEATNLQPCSGENCTVNQQDEMISSSSSEYSQEIDSHVQNSDSDCESMDSDELARYHKKYGNEGNKCHVSYPLPLWETRKLEQPCGLDVEECRSCREAPYRELSGICNNRENNLGVSGTPFLRVLKARYEDGVSKVVKSTDHGKLPSPRLISTTLFKDAKYPDEVNSLLLMQWGQIVAHDTGFQVEKTKVDGSSINCCSKNPLAYLLKRLFKDDNCLPISIPKGDYFYSQYSQSCMNFVRSVWIKCPKQESKSSSSEEWRKKKGNQDDKSVQQINHVSSFLDVSVLYGNDDMIGSQLRVGKNGLLKARRVRSWTNEYDSYSSNEESDELKGMSFGNGWQRSPSWSKTECDSKNGHHPQKGKPYADGPEEGGLEGDHESNYGSLYERGNEGDLVHGDDLESDEESSNGSSYETENGSDENDNDSGSQQRRRRALQMNDHSRSSEESSSQSDSGSHSSSSSSTEAHVPNEFLPLFRDETKSCPNNSHAKTPTYLAGDERVDIHPWLASNHVLLLREHNRLARELRRMHPKWRDERLYQEARRIVIAEVQLITYREYLPKIVGKGILEKMGMLMDSKWEKKGGKYNAKVNPSTMLVFTSAAFRYLHTLITGSIQTQNEGRCPLQTFEFNDLILHASVMERSNFLTSIFRGMTNQPSGGADTFLTNEITNKLMKLGKPFGVDLASIDIQRGRDHGVPSYNDMRMMCGLPKAKTFEDFKDVMSHKKIQQLKKLYHSVKDVELLVGGYMEDTCWGESKSGIVGHTFACIISEQFYRWWKGDRYFFDMAEGPGRFTHGQFKALLKVTLSSLLCENLDGLKYMQEDAFGIVSNTNPLRMCKDIPRLDMKPWDKYNLKENCATKKKKNQTNNKSNSSNYGSHSTSSSSSE